MANSILDIIKEIGLAKEIQGLRPEDNYEEGIPFLPTSHIFESGEDEGKYAAWPSLFYNPKPLEEGQKAWEDLSGRKDWAALKEAKKRTKLGTKELFTFPTKDASERIAEGGWKQENLEPFIKGILENILGKNYK